MKKIIISSLFIIFILSVSIFAIAAEEQFDGYIIKVKDSPNVISLNEFSKSDNTSENITAINNSNDLFYIKSLDDLPDYINKDNIEYIEPNYKFTLSEIPNDSYYTYEWYMKNINAASIWESGCYGEGIKIAVIDSGVSKHNDLANNLLEGYNFIDKTTDTSDSNGHGTFVSGLIAAEANNSFLTAGLAYRAKIVPLKCFSSTNSDTRYIIEAIKAAVDNYGCKIINISAGTGSTSLPLKEAVEYATSKGAIVVAASGNHDDKKEFNRIEYPASYDCVVSVGSVDSSNVISDFSNYNEYVDVVAPGEGVVSLSYINDNGLSQGSGTSFATPLVSAAAAVCSNINPDITYKDFLNIIEKTSLDLGDEGKDVYYGYGLIDLKAILENMLEGKDYFVSPFDFEAENMSAVIYNNTNTNLDAFNIWADNGEKELTKISIPAKSGKHIYLQPLSDSFTNYLWALNLKPLAKTTFYYNK